MKLDDVRALVAQWVEATRATTRELRRFVEDLERRGSSEGATSSTPAPPLAEGQTLTDMQNEIDVDQCAVCGGDNAIATRVIAPRTAAPLEVAVCATCARLSAHLAASKYEDRVELARRAAERERADEDPW